MFDAPSDGTIVARLDAPTAERPTELAVLSDPHVAVDAVGTWKVFERTLVERLGGVDVVGVDTVTTPSGGLRETHDGTVTDDEVAWLERVLADLDDPVVLMHHNLPGVLDQFRSYRDRVDPAMGLAPRLRDSDSLVSTLAGSDVSLVLSGHVHFTTVAETDGVRELVVPPLCSFPQGYLLLSVDDDGTTVRFVTVADGPGLEEAYAHALEDSATAQGRASLAGIRIAGAPLVDDRSD